MKLDFISNLDGFSKKGWLFSGKDTLNISYKGNKAGFIDLSRIKLSKLAATNPSRSSALSRPVTRRAVKEGRYLGEILLSPHESPFASVRQLVDFTLSQMALSNLLFFGLTNNFKVLKKNRWARIPAILLHTYIVTYLSVLAHEGGHSNFYNAISSRLTSLNLHTDKVFDYNTYGFKNVIAYIWPTSGYINTSRHEKIKKEYNHLRYSNKLLDATFGWNIERLIEEKSYEKLFTQGKRAHLLNLALPALHGLGRLVYFLTYVADYNNDLEDTNFVKYMRSKNPEGKFVRPTKLAYFGQLLLELLLNPYIANSFMHFIQYFSYGKTYVKPWKFNVANLSFSLPLTTLIHKRTGYFYKFSFFMHHKKDLWSLKACLGFPINFIEYREWVPDEYDKIDGYKINEPPKKLPIPDTQFGFWIKLYNIWAFGRGKWYSPVLDLHAGLSVNKNSDTDKLEIGSAFGFTVKSYPLIWHSNIWIKRIFFGLDFYYSFNDLVSQHQLLLKNGYYLRAFFGAKFMEK
ncbi:MAG: hypothetical protein ABIE74_04285 [Pseudomonadota bacterium]